MAEVVGDTLPLALGVAFSPLIAAILTLLAPRAGAASAGFLIGWIGGIVAAATVTTIIAQSIGLSTPGTGCTIGAVVELAIGTLMLLLAARQWRGRPRGDTPPPPPKWVSAVASVTPSEATGLGFVMAAVNPKNLLLVLGAGVAVGAAALPLWQVVLAIAIFTLIAASLLTAPVVIYRIAHRRARIWLARTKTWLVTNNAAVMVVLFAVIGAVLIGKGLAGF